MKRLVKATITKKAYFDDINEDILLEIYDDILNGNYNFKSIADDSTDWEYKVSGRGNKVAVTLSNESEDISNTTTFDLDEFEDLDENDFVEQVTEFYYA